MLCAPLRGSPGGGSSRAWRWGRWLLGLALPTWTGDACAQAVGASTRALPAVIRMGAATPARAPLSVAAAAGYGYLDQRGLPASGHRAYSALAVAVSPIESLAIAADAQAWWDEFRRDDESNGYLEPRLTARYIADLMPTLAVGVEADVRWIGRRFAAIQFPATSPSVRGLALLEPAPQTRLVANLGFHWDRSAEAIRDHSRLTLPDRRTVNASDANALQWGVGLSHQVTASSELLVELSGETAVGSRAYTFPESPLRTSAGIRHQLSDQLSLLTVFESSLSQRPLLTRESDLLPMDPKLSALAALIWHYDSGRAAPNDGSERRLSERAVAQPPEQAPPDPAPTEPQTEPERRGPALEQGDAEASSDPAPAPSEATPSQTVEGIVVDEGGRPLADVEVRLELNGELHHQRTFADGSFRFAAVPQGPAQLRVETPSFDPASVQLDPQRSSPIEIVLRPAVPAGQVRGKVLDLAGTPVAATVTVTPGEVTLEVQPDGSFELELAPGKYVLHFQHANFASQRRRVNIGERGVVIVNIALTR